MIDPSMHDLIERYYAAMRARAHGADGMAALFAEDAVYVEPFSNVQTDANQCRHIGRDAIVAYFERSFPYNPPDLAVQADRMDILNSQIRVEWTCTSSAFPAPVRGIDIYTIKGALITNLETILLPPK